jgi:hypothetical protein
MAIIVCGGSFPSPVAEDIPVRSSENPKFDEEMGSCSAKDYILALIANIGK